MVKHGGLELAMTEAVWEHTFKELEEQKKAETILQTLDGMSIASAKELLNKCEQCLGTLIIRSCE
ncbi:MAG: hypothetical protein ACLVFU_01410 [Eggerthellaceae bacterium]|jgi:hypothetical protein|nr:MAG TPA: hypothetical protein [Caudoviricetes sp.]HBM32189.1 hypothetical protein [Oscillospiraceae bacterium]HCK51102.1 hypothetical protein [Oscillospiraceae bacterium]